MWVGLGRVGWMDVYTATHPKPHTHTFAHTKPPPTPPPSPPPTHTQLPSFPRPGVRMADLTNFQRPRGSVPLDDPDSGINVGRSEVEMEVI